jgi:hypothetical protein
MIDHPTHRQPCWPHQGEAESSALDRWVREDLRRRFGKAKDEPLPAEWLDMLGEA